MNKIKKLSFIIPIVVGFVLVSGLMSTGTIAQVAINDNHTDLGVIVTEDANNDANVRVAHLISDAPAVNILVNGTAAFSDVAYKDVTEYAALSVGLTYNFTVVVASSGALVFDPVITPLAADTDYTVAAVGLLADSSQEPLLLVDDNTPVPTDTSRVRVAHTSPDTPAVDVNASVTTGLLSDVEFKQSAYLEVAAGEYDLGVYVAGTDTLGIDLTGTAVAGGYIYTVFAVGTLDDGDSAALEPLLVVDSAPDADVRVLHAVPDAPAVDVLVNGSAAFTDAPYKGVTDYAALDYDVAGYNFTVVQNGTDGPAVLGPLVTPLANSTDYTVVAAGNLSTIEAVILVDDNSPVDEGKSRLRVAHFSPNAPAVDITLSDGTVLVSNLAFKDAGYIEVDAGTYDLQVRAAGTDTVVLDLADTTVAEGSVYTVTAVGYLEVADDTDTETSSDPSSETTTETSTMTTDDETSETSEAEETEEEDSPFNAVFAIIGLASVSLALSYRNRQR